MNINDFRLAITSSVEDVKFLSDQRKKLGDQAFEDKVYEIFKKYLSNEKMISYAISSKTYLWEISVLWELENEHWFQKAFNFLMSSLLSTIKTNRELGLKYIEQESSVFFRSLEACHDAFYLSNTNNIKNDKHKTRALFRILGDVIESVHKKQIEFIYGLINLKEFYSLESSKSFGAIISEIILDNELKEIYKEKLLSLPLSQWRNIAHHSSYYYDEKTKIINCKYGVRNEKKLDITLDQLYQILYHLNLVMALHKISVEFLLLEYLDEINWDNKNSINIETLCSKIGHALALSGYQVKEIRKNKKIILISVIDKNLEGIENFKKCIFEQSYALVMMKEMGYILQIHLFNVDGIKLTEFREIQKN